MKRLFLGIISTLSIAATGSAFGGNQFSESYSVDTFVPCLGETLRFNFAFSGVYHEILDANGGLHINMNGKLAGDFVSMDSDKSWVGRGRRHLMLNSNMDWDPGENGGTNQLQFRRTYSERLTVFADGPYPDLLWTLEFTIVVDANFQITRIYTDPGTTSCLYD